MQKAAIMSLRTLFLWHW